LNARVLAAFGHRCGRCGKIGVPVEIHHRDHDVTNNSMANLVPLCKPCHAKAGLRLF
jgi:5-methylcytosine-specific restriction endonuclease McrA